MPDAFSAKNDEPLPSLGRLLFRFDCPEPQVLGEYQLDVLDAEQRLNVARHAAECQECAAELTELRAFLAVDPPVPETMFERARRVLATLITPAPELVLHSLRGADDAATLQFEAEDVSITVSPGAERGGLVGLLTGEVETVGHAVELRADGQRAANTTVDDLGNFEFEGLPAGGYTLELELGDRVIVIENLQID